VTEGAAGAIERLVAAGARFDRLADGFDLGREGGHGRRRVLRVGDATGLEVDRVLEAAVRASPRIRVMPRLFVIDLLTAAGRCVGLLARRQGDGEICIILGRAVVVAAGGAGRLFRETSNVRGATGDGIAAAFRAGAELRDLEFVQFHPTTLYLAGTDRILVTEAVRGEGATIVDNLGRRFLQDVHPAAELAPRDVVSRAIVDQLGKDGVTDVFLDMTHWPLGHAAKHFPGLVATCARYGLDPGRDRIPVRPAAHYFIGGIASDLDGKTSLEGLSACGEAACSGLHGANRLASNSLLEGLVLGERAGRAAAEAASGAAQFEGRIVHRAGRHRPRETVDVGDLRDSLTNRMWRSVGIIRDAAGLTDAVAAIRTWRRFLSDVSLFGRAGFELENLLLLGELVALSALQREESRGTHCRNDYPGRDDAHFLGSFLWREGERARFRRMEAVAVG
jgi:L-aspartate oxidase